MSNYVDCFFDAYWQNGLDLSDDKVLNSLLDKLEINFNEFKTFVSDQKIKNKLIEKTNDAVKLGIFGAPSFMVNNKLFWGQDRLEFALIEAKK